MSRSDATTRQPIRVWVVLAFLSLGMVLLIARAAYLQIFTADYLQEQGNARHLRAVEDGSHRGMILDRNGEPLAISTPVESVWANPEELVQQRAAWPALQRLLGFNARDFNSLIAKNADRDFMYLKRHVPPELADQVMALKVPGVALQQEYRRYYPSGAVTGHIVGFTNVDDQGQEGVELAYDEWLRAQPGKKRVLKDRFGNLVETVESIQLPAPGKDLKISIDRRVQYLAYRELSAAVEASQAQGGSAIVLDAHTGEVLALVNEPSFNPNNRSNLRSGVFRNRAVTDVFEPGSTLKPFTIATALESGKFSPNTTIDTSPGFFKVGSNTVHDTHDYGRLTVAGVIEKSSNVGASKIALSLSKDKLYDMFHAAGFGTPTGSHLPGEVRGVLMPVKRWGQIEQATMSYGYGISVTPLQLARAYTALANDGVLMPVRLTAVDANEPPVGERIMSAKTARELRAMLELAVSGDGTGKLAQVANYNVAGKTGTVHKLAGRGYAKDDYLAFFAGFAPANDPRLVMVVLIDQPARGGYYGGEQAAPVFSRVMQGALRLLDIPPDAPNIPLRRIARARIGEAPT